MLITGKLGNIHKRMISHDVDVVIIEWYETNKRILHKQTESGIAITTKFLNENPNLEDGDILWQDENSIIAVQIKPCECIVITPATMLIVASLCYEIGNRHLALFYEGDELVVPFEGPLHNLLQASGYQIKVEKRKLNNPLKTTVLPHLQVAGAGSLFSKILQPSTF